MGPVMTAHHMSRCRRSLVTSSISLQNTQWLLSFQSLVLNSLMQHTKKTPTEIQHSMLWKLLNFIYFLKPNMKWNVMVLHVPLAGLEPPFCMLLFREKKIVNGNFCYDKKKNLSSIYSVLYYLSPKFAPSGAHQCSNWIFYCPDQNLRI